MSGAPHLEAGRAAETAAARHLERAGYRILKQNFRAARKPYSSAPAFLSRAIRCVWPKQIVTATTHYDDPAMVLEASRQLGEAMPGIEICKLPKEELLQYR